MKFEPKDQERRNQRILTCVGLSVILGIVVGQLFDFEDRGKLHLVSITKRGPLADLALMVAVTVMILGAVRMTAAMGPRTLIVLGTVLVLAALAGPNAVSRISPNTRSYFRTATSFLLLATLIFIGAAFLGAGLRRLSWQKQEAFHQLDKSRKTK